MHFVKEKILIFSYGYKSRLRKKKNIVQNLKVKKEVLECLWKRNPENVVSWVVRTDYN